MEHFRDYGGLNLLTFWHKIVWAGMHELSDIVTLWEGLQRKQNTLVCIASGPSVKCHFDNISTWQCVNMIMNKEYMPNEDEEVVDTKVHAVPTGGWCLPQWHLCPARLCSLGSSFTFLTKFCPPLTNIGVRDLEHVVSFKWFSVHL